MDRDGLNALEALILAAAAVAAVAVGVVWGGATLGLVVAGRPAVLGARQAGRATVALPALAGDPGAAWGAAGGPMPGAAVYWSSTAVVAVAAVVLVVVVARWAPWGGVGPERRRPLGVDGRARFATARELRPLLVRRPVPGRFVVARSRRWLVATEVPRRRRRGRAGDRGAVALIGPSRSGKTTAAVAGLLDWDGPAVVSSVKTDLLGVSGGWRATVGEVRVYDPTGSTPSAGHHASWSPVDQAATTIGAVRAARALCDAAPKSGVEGGLDFWLAQAEILLAGLLFVAHHSCRDMGAVCDWVLMQDRPSDQGDGEVHAAITALVKGDDPTVAAGVQDAARGVVAVWEMDDGTRSSVYATAQTIVWPWAEPSVAASAARSDDSVDLGWLLDGSNTLYLCAPLEDHQRLAPAFGGLLNDLIGQVYRHVASTGRPLDPPLLLLVDEAGNTPLRALPSYASTLAGLGVVLVTVWQSLAQVQTAYGKAADTVLTNHLTKVIYSGLSDEASLRYVAQVLGDSEVTSRSRSHDHTVGGRSSLQVSTTRLPLAPPHALRQMRRGDALLVHGTLPPAHVHARPFYRSRRLRGRAALPWPPTSRGH